MANSSSPGFRTTTHSPEELERFAALFIPTWELPPDVAAGPDPGFRPVAIDAATVAALSGDELPKARPAAIKATMMGLAASLPLPDQSAPAVRSEPPPRATAPAAPVMAAPAAPIAPPPAFVARSIDEDDLAPPKKSKGALFAALGALVVVAGVGAFFALRSGDEPQPAKKETVTEKKAADLPEPEIESKPATKVAAPKDDEPALKAAPKETAAPKDEPAPKATAKAEPPPPPPP
ncbi:MAG: hypothetical protein HYV09_03685, partial [Deltaproteobacteria bacterium]|nr:hypothetical protein [Deltaproteobacteria bacterium]